MKVETVVAGKYIYGVYIRNVLWDMMMVEIVMPIDEIIVFGFFTNENIMHVGNVTLLTLYIGCRDILVVCRYTQFIRPSLYVAFT